MQGYLQYCGMHAGMCYGYSDHMQPIGCRFYCMHASILQWHSFTLHAGSPNEISAGEQAKSSSHDVDSVTNSCISNWKQLLDLFHKDRPVRLDRQTMLIFFHVRILHSLESTCCTLNDSNDSCIMMASLVHSLFGQYPPPLLLLLGGAGISQLSPQKYNGILSKAVKEICWEPQIPFCHEVLHFSSGIIKDFVAKVNM